MTTYNVPKIGDKVRNLTTGREFVVMTLDVIDFGCGDGPELCISVKGNRGEDDIWSGKATAFAPIVDKLCPEPTCSSPGVCPGGCAAKTSPAAMSTPTLVREFARRHAVATAAQHARHCIVVDELRSRSVLD